MRKIRPTLMRDEACNALKGFWNISAVTILIYMVILVALEFILSLVVHKYLLSPIAMILLSPLTVGLYFVFLDLVQSGIKPQIDRMFDPFKEFVRYAGAYLVITVFVILWTLLLIVPGFIKSMSYSMTLYLMRENPEMTIMQAINRSEQMMKGYKMDLFLLQLSFIGWAILSVFTLFIAYLWLAPYMLAACAAFYVKLKEIHSAAAPSCVPAQE